MSRFYTQHGKAGDLYEKGEYKGIKDLAKKTRAFIKENFKGYKVSVTKESYSGGCSINVSLMEAPFEVFGKDADDSTKRDGYSQVNHYNLTSDDDDYYTKEASDFFIKVNSFLNRYHMDDSDGMIDYFNTNFYKHFAIGKWDKPFVNTLEVQRIAYLEELENA